MLVLALRPSGVRQPNAIWSCCHSSVPSAWALGPTHSGLPVTMNESWARSLGRGMQWQRQGPRLPLEAPFYLLSPSVLRTYSHCCRVPGLAEMNGVHFFLEY